MTATRCPTELFPGYRENKLQAGLARARRPSLLRAGSGELQNNDKATVEAYWVIPLHAECRALAGNLRLHSALLVSVSGHCRNSSKLGLKQSGGGEWDTRGFGEESSHCLGASTLWLGMHLQQMWAVCVVMCEFCLEFLDRSR